MNIQPVAKLDIGSIKSVTLPEYDGVYQLERCGEQVGLVPKLHLHTDTVDKEFLVIPGDNQLNIPGKHHGGLEMPYFGWCDVYELV